MRAKGFRLVTLSASEIPTVEDKRRAIELNTEWDAVRRGVANAAALTYPPGSVGDGYQRAMKMREAERAARGKKQSNEQASRDDWPRAWKWLEPLFGDVNPRTIRPEHFISIDVKTGDVSGLIPTVERAVSITERHRTIKVWRALWKKMAAMRYCERDADPSLAFANSAPDPRQEIWQRHEVLRLVQCAWRNKYHGLAAVMAVAWDTMLSPIDVRRLVASQRARDGHGAVFFVDRAKTGRAAAGTLTRWSEAILEKYLVSLGADLHGNAPLFRNRSGLPYSKDTLGDDFREIRRIAFLGDNRQLADMRRSGAVEADAGGTTPHLARRLGIASCWRYSGLLSTA